MHFLSPLFALFTVLFAVPVAIHLYGRSRARTRRFPAMYFLLAGHRRVAARTRLRQILLLLLRALVMAAVPLCLAKPFFETTSDLPAQVSAAQSAVLLIDDSLAMGYRLSGESLLSVAKSRAARLVDAMGRDADAALVLGSRGAMAPVPELTTDRARLLRAISSVNPSYRPVDLSAAFKRAAQILSAGRGNGRRIYLLSDLSAHALEPGLQAPPDIDVVPVDVADGKALPNRAIADLHVDPAPALGQSGVRITAEVANHGDTAIKELPVTLLVDGKAVTRGLLDLVGRGRATKRFYHVLSHGHTPPGPPDSRDGKEGPVPRPPGDARAQRTTPEELFPAGIHDITVELPADDLAGDDRRYLRVEVQRTLRVLLIDGDPRTLRRDDEVFYVEVALRPGDREDSRFELQTTTVEDLGHRTLGEYDAVFLCNVKAQDLSRGHTEKSLRDYVAGGGGLFITLGDNTDPDAYNSTLSDLLPQPLSGTKTAGPVRHPGEESGSVSEGREATLSGSGERLGHLDRRHPLLLPFAGGHAMESLLSARFGRYMLLRPTPRTTAADDAGDKGGTVTVLLSYESGAPALIERTLQGGHVLLFTSTIDRDWNDLPIQPAFLPLLQQAVRYLARAPLRDTEPPILIGQRHEIKLRDGDTRVEVTLPSGQKRLFEGERLKGRRVLGFADTDEPGLYRVSTAGEGGLLRPRPAEFFAVNIDPAESDLHRASAQRLAALQRPPSGGGLPDQTAPRRRVELWHTIGALLLLLLLGEALLLREK